MLSNILTVATQVLILFILILVGVISNKTKLLNKEAVKKLADFVLYIVSPAVIISSFNRKMDTAMLKGLGIIFIAAIVIHIINILMAYAFIHDKDKARERVLRMATVFSNCGYMSLPLQQAILGANGVFYGAAYVAVFNIVLWTFGEWLMKGGGKVSFKNLILNPGILGTLIGIILFFTSIQLPEVIAEPIKYLAGLNTPVPMIIIGFHLAGANFKIKGINEILTMFLRLIVSPIIMVFGLYLLGIKGEVMIVSAIAASAPVAAVVTMFSNKYDADTPLSASMVSVSTIISIITMPIIVGIAQSL